MSLADLVPDESEALTIVEPKPLAKASPIDSIREVEDRLILKSIHQLEDALHWADVDIGTVEPPEEWVKELGSHKAAMRRLRAVQAAQMCNKESPVGLKHSKEFLIGAMKARATEKAAPRNLNIQVGHIDFVLPSFPTKKVER